MALAIEVLPIGFVAVGARAWRSQGRRLLTAVVKITCALQPDAPMSLIAPQPLVEAERHWMNNPVASLVRASDLALFVPRSEIVVVGSAHAGTNQTATQLTVRLAVQRDGVSLINKRIDVVGDRRMPPGADAPAPLPFARMPIVYERALGGLTSRENPVGVGLEPGPDGLITLPNIGGQSQVVPHGLGPIPSSWPARARRRGSLSWASANQSLDVDVPPDFDDGYFQTAPADQQTNDLLPGDVIAIVNMHPDHAMLRTTLPTGRALALAQNERGERFEIDLRIDTVHIEPESLRAENVYRGVIAAPDDSAFDSLRVAGAFEPSEKPFTFPDLANMQGLVARQQTAAAQAPVLDSTAVLAPEDAPPPPQVPRTDYYAREPEIEEAPRAVRPAQVTPAPTFGPPPSALVEAFRTGSPVRQRTIEIVADDAQPSSLPFIRNPGDEAKSHEPPRVSLGDDSYKYKPRTGTLEITVEPEPPQTIVMRQPQAPKPLVEEPAPVDEPTTERQDAEAAPAPQEEAPPPQEEPHLPAAYARQVNEQAPMPTVTESGNGSADPYDSQGIWAEESTQAAPPKAPTQAEKPPSSPNAAQRATIRNALYQRAKR